MPKAYLELEEVQQLEGAGEYLRDKLLIRLTFRLGCRISETLGIAVGDIDFEQAMVTIEHLKVRVNLSCPACGTRLSKTARFCPGCALRVEEAIAEEKEHRRVRTLPIDSETLDMIREYIDRGGPVSHNGKQLLFGISRRHAWKIISNCAERAGLGELVNPETGKIHGVSPHKLRDAFAVHAVKLDDSTDSIRVLQEHLGHANIGTTMKYRKIA
ncbi:MAG: tyrosine-type recombinase/integrase, partial [Desulfobacterales bacterium]|nr:tyrosine-type recombinase/integrase [Desulfobacterales bacterium]